MGNTRAILKFVVLILLLGIAGVVIWKKFSNGVPTDYDFDVGEGGKVKIPKSMQINYRDIDFKSTLSEQEVMKIMSNPTLYRRDFGKMVYQLNMDMLLHVGKRMNLPDSLMQNVEKEYRKHHNYLKDLYYFDIIALKDTSSSMYERWYDSDASSSIEVLNEVSAKYTCFLVNHVMTSLLKNPKGLLSVKGNKVYSPCSVAMEEGLKPLVKRLEDRAVIEDFKKSKGILEERMERVIGELATIEIRDKKGLTKEKATKVWGYKVSTTEVEITAISVMKVGFKLDEYFEVNTDTKNRVVSVTLPEPKILSHEVYPKVDKLDVGWMREVSNEDFNDNFNLLRREFRRDAMESSAFNRSKKEAEKLLKNIMEPMVQSIHRGYTIQVNYRGGGVPNEFE